jgi:two-component system cell cycle sensor histidine kinase/response regulator CckA
MDPLDRAPRAGALLSLNRATTTVKLFSGAVHEANNALHVISGTVELAADRDLPASLVTALERIQRQSVVAAEALARVIEFTRAPLEGETDVDVAAVVTQSAALRAFAVRRAGVTLRVEQAAEPVVVRGNRGRIQQAILNVIINAEHSIARGSGVITISTAVSDDAVTVCVVDNGTGVPNGVDPFLPFCAPETAAERMDQPVGLGLWAARTILTASGGELTLESARPGTVVVMTLPRRR